MSFFEGNLNSDYHKASNIDDTGRSPQRIQAYVEGEDDVPFWYRIFRKFLPEREVFINPSTRGDSARGKKAVLRLKDDAGEFMFLCLDSDYDFLVTSSKCRVKLILELSEPIIRGVLNSGFFHLPWSLKNINFLLPDIDDYAMAINNSPFIFQTYAYAIENYKCFSHSLDCICVDLTCNADVKFDFSKFLREYSGIIYDLFLHFILSKRNNMLIRQISFEEFHANVTFSGRLELSNNAEKELQKLKHRIAPILERVKKQNSEAYLEKETISLAAELRKFGLQRDNVYLFVKGHVLFDGVVVPIMKQVVHDLKSQKRSQLIKEATNDEERNRMIATYFDKRKKPDPIVLLSLNMDFHECPLMNKIKVDIDKYRYRHCSVYPPMRSSLSSS